ncbi:MAG: response regulator transcription factor [Gammaproteobacteria bacterium]
MDLLLADDDETFCEVLAEALRNRGFHVHVAYDVPSALEVATKRVFTHAVVDLQMPGPSGLELVARLCERNPGLRLVVLTGYASIATAVEAIKLGATHYLTKPAEAEEIVAAFRRATGVPDTPIPEKPISVGRLQWEHIHKVLDECEGNVSAAARRLGMHRRTLQRKLYKHPVEH